MLQSPMGEILRDWDVVKLLLLFLLAAVPLSMDQQKVEKAGPSPPGVNPGALFARPRLQRAGAGGSWIELYLS